MKQSCSLLVQSPEGRYLLIQRSSNCKKFTDLWEFPGGKLDEDESMGRALLREVKEEIGIDVPEPAGEPERRILTPSAEFEYAFFSWTAPSAGEHEILGRPIVLSEEHRAYRWATFKETRKLRLVQVHREFLEWHWLQRQIHLYETQEQARYKRYAATLRAVLEKLKDRWAPLAIVQARAKDLSSFAEKCLRRADELENPVYELTDLCGGRIITTTTQEASTICRQIRKLFHPVDEEDDTSQRHGISAFGYLSVHFLVHFATDRKEMLGVEIPPEIAGLKAEVQVRTLLQHAHAEVTHDRLYKAGYKPPQHCERGAYRMAAVLENTDEEFARFVAQLDAYVGHYAAHLSPEQRQRRFADLKLVQEHEQGPEKRVLLALRMARLCRAAWDWPGVIAALEPFTEAGCHEHPSLCLELGNALCRLHREAPRDPAFLRGRRLLEKVADLHGPEVFLELPERTRQATALAWLGSALSKITGERATARACLAKAVELMPDDPYHLTSFVELDLAAEGRDDHISLLSPSLRQAAGRCQEHIQAGIEVTRSWVTLAKIRLLLQDQTGAVEALCLAHRAAETPHPLADLQRSLDRTNDAIGTHRPFVGVLDRAADLLAKFKAANLDRPAGVAFDWQPFAQRSAFDSQERVLILTGDPAALRSNTLAGWERPLRDALTGFAGSVVTGGPETGVCALVARLAEGLHTAGLARLKPVSYPSGQALEGTGSESLSGTAAPGELALLGALQMWTDLLLSGVEPSRVTLLCLGGAEVAAQELALAWTLGARTAVVDGDSLAVRRFTAVLASAGDDASRGMVLPADAATLRAFIPFDVPIEKKRWDKPGQAVHEDYVKNQHQRSKQPNLLPWELLREDFRHSNRHQAACAVEILRQNGFMVESTDLPADQIPGPIFEETEIETMAEREHGRWNVERLNQGWRWAEKKDEERKLSPYLVPWAKLSEAIRDYDRAAVRIWHRVLAQAGLVVKRG